jgi:hypothetical protein
MRTRSYITILAAMMIDAALFGTGIVIVLSTPALREYAAFLIPLVLAASLVAAPLIGWKLAPAVRAEAIHRAHMQSSDGY